jgi:DNA-binding transcriptional regulator YiaG
MSKILDTVYETAKGLYEAGLLERKALVEFRKLCKSENPFKEAERIRYERDQEFLTQFGKEKRDPFPSEFDEKDPRSTL